MKKYIGIRISEDIDNELQELIKVKETETGIKLSKTQVIESLIKEGLKKFNTKENIKNEQ